MSKCKYNAALIGTGRIGFTLGFDSKREQPASHAMALKENRRIKLVAACDSDPTKLNYFHRFNRKPHLFNDYSYLFATTKVDIVTIAVNENAHLEAALAAIRARPRLVILEKPVALSVAEGMKIFNEAKTLNIPVLINHERRFAEDYKLAKEYIKQIGQIQTINARLDSGLYVYNPDAEATGEYCLWHDGTHLVDIVSYLLEQEDSEKENQALYDAEDSGERKILKNARITQILYDDNSKIIRSINVHMQSDNCKDVNIFISGKSRFFGFELDVIGTEGRIRIGNGIFEFSKRVQSKLYSGFYSLEKDELIKMPKKTRYFSNMVKNAVDFLDGKERLKSTLANGLRTLRVLEDIKNQIKEFDELPF